RGGDVILIADKNLNTLIDFRYRRKYVAKRGGQGFIAAVVSFLLTGKPDPATGIPPKQFFGLLILLVAVVIQKSIFILMRIDVSKLGKKDWFYQGFMTFCAWGIALTMMMTTFFSDKV
ncbi:MAG TPA: hypothetical protein O0X32_01975, partial [Methanocorpusculum sp.]|nr:hypothetical protein [Methanocorpusculum sp.]